MSPSIEDFVNTYETTPDEERIKYGISAEMAEKPAVQKYSREQLQREHLRNLELLSKSKPSVRQFALFAAYSPSSSSLDTLQKISFNDLKLEVHHRGSFLTAKTISPPYQSTKLITLIQEAETGQVSRLVLDYEYESFFGAGSNLPENSTVAIKEPYCKFNGEGDYVICVDHPSDIAILRGDDAAVSMIMDFVTEKKEIAPVQWKEAGDKAYLAKNYSSAIECYTQAIETAPSVDHEFIRDTRRKRAFANLTAKSFRAAKEDALATCAGDSLDEKAYFYAGKAAYMLGKFAESKTYFGKSLQLCPSDWKYQNEHNRAIARVNEEEGGTYNFGEMAKSVSNRIVHQDNADFTKNTCVRDTPEHGRGLFTTRDISAGELVLCEKAFCLPDKYTGDGSADLVMYNFNNSGLTQRSGQAALFLELVQKLYKNPDQCRRFFDLDGGKYIRSGNEGKLIDGVPVIDTFLVEAIRLKNCFSSPRLTSALLKPNPVHSDHCLTTGLWTRAAYINHACLANCTRSFIGDMMILRANTFIPAGTEITHQYLWPEAWYSKRKDTFPNTWDFECDCRLCSTEKKSPELNHTRRGNLVAKIKKEVLAAPSSIQSSTIRKVERLTKGLEDLHEPEIYAKIPRLLLIHPTIWLTEAYRRSKNPSKTVRYAGEVLRNFGHLDVLREKDGKWDIVLEGDGIKNSEVFNALRFMAEGYRSLGRMELSERALDEARKIYLILTGSQVGMEEGLQEGFWGVKEKSEGVVGKDSSRRRL